MTFTFVLRTRSLRRTSRPLGVGLTGFSLVLLSVSAHAQDDLDAELKAGEQEVSQAAEPAPAPTAEAVPDAAPPAFEAPTDGAAGPSEAEQAAAQVPLTNNSKIEEVVVTADRRRKSLQTYSGTAQAFTQQKMAQVGVTGVSGLSSMVPGLQIGQQEGNTEVYIRGVGNDNNAEHGDMGVAVHLDGVYLPRPRGVGSMFFDIERVEVASGPQGTLRGRNAQGGSIDIITAKPKLGEYGANAQATFGTFSERRYEGMVNIPLGETLAIRFAGLSSRHDPHWENAGPLNDLRGSQDEDLYAMRLSAKWQPTTRFSALASADFTREAGTGYIGANFNTALRRQNDNNTPAIPADDFLDPVDPNEDVKNPRRIYQLGHQAREDMKHKGARLNLTYDFGSFSLDAFGSYRDLVYTQVTGGSAGVIYPGFNFQTQGTDFWGSSYWNTRSQSQVFELRAYAPDSARFRWTAGVFGLREQQQVVLYQASDPVNGYAGAEFNMPNVDGDSYAAFADATFDVTSKFRVLGGLRATTETKSRTGGLGMQLGGSGNLGRLGTEGFEPRYFDRTLYTVDQSRAALTNADLPPALRNLPDNDPAKTNALDVAARVNLYLDGVKSFGARDTAAIELCEPVPLAAPQTVQQTLVTVRDDGSLRCTNGIREGLARTTNGFNVAPTPQNAKTTNFFLDWRAGVEYDLAKDAFLYATVSTAHKAAGYNDNVNTAVPFNLYYGPESVVAYEIGSKNTLADRRLRLNGALFWYQYNDQVFQQIVQIGEVVDGMQANTTALRQNAANSHIYGLNVDAVYALPLGLEATLNALVMDARYGERTLVQDGRIDFNVGRYEVDLEGKWLPRASKYTLNYSLSQMLYTEVGRFNWIVQGQTRSQHFMSAFNGKGNLLPEANGRVPGEADPQTGATLPASNEYTLLTQNAARLTDVVPLYTRFDAGIGWQHADGRIGITGYVNNVTNVVYATSIISSPNLNLRFYNPPRTAGIRVRVDW
jgi:iron complex outermembrane recepter protein